MKKIFYSILSIVLASCTLSMVLPLTAAAELKPVVAISFSGYSELMADIEAFGKLSGRPELAQILEGMLAMVTQGKGLAGLDKDKPLGAVLLSDGSEDFTIYGFLPTSDLKQLMELMKNLMPGESPKVANGVYEISAGMESVYVTQKDNWAYVAQKKETFDAVSKDPAALLGNMPKNYLLALRATVRNIPESVREKGLAGFQTLMQMSMQRNPEESDVQYAARAAMMKQNADQIERLSKELDEVMLGINLDRQLNSTYLDLELLAKPGTKLAAQLAANKPGKSDFTGLKIPGAALTANGTVAITDDDVARAKSSLEVIRTSTQEELKNQKLDKERLDLATEVLNELVDVAVKTIDLKKTDYGMSLVLEPNGVTIVAGIIAADCAKLEAAIEKLLAEDVKDKVLKLKTETYQGVRFHTYTYSASESTSSGLGISDLFRGWPYEIFGRPLMVDDTLNVVIGIGDKKAFIAAGRDAAKTLKEAIDRSQSQAGKEIPASEIVLSGLKIAKFVSRIADDEHVKAVADKMAEALEQSAGKDHLTIVTQAIANGCRIRLEIEEGILKSLGGIPDISIGQ